MATLPLKGLDIGCGNGVVRELYASTYLFFKNPDADYIPEEPWKEDEAKFYAMLQDDLPHFNPRVILINTRDHLPALLPYFKISEYLRRNGTNLWLVVLGSKPQSKSALVCDVRLRQSGESQPFLSPEAPMLQSSVNFS